MTEGKLGTRARVLAAIVAFLFAALVTRLWFLQVLAAETYQQRAETNRVRLVPIPAPRGQVLDRNGNVLVDNRNSIQLTVNRRFVPNVEELLLKLSELLEVPVKQLADRLNDPDYLPFQPVPIAEDVPERTVYHIKEHQEEFPGVNYREVAVRKHVHGNLAAHVLGYLGEVGPQELGSPAFRGYRPGDRVGRGGVEQAYERFLRGRDGWLKLEVDSEGQPLGSLGRREPGAGNDLVLSLDLGIQRHAEQSLQEGIQAARGIATTLGYLQAPAGAVVVLDPTNGQVLAMASYPPFDPRVFQRGISDEQWDQLNSKAAGLPLINRAVQGLYPPGSTIKPFVASAAVKHKVAKPGEYFNCPPTFEVPGDTSGTVFHNWKSTHSGFISLPQSLIESCDTVYYGFGLNFYRDYQIRGEALQRELRRFGFGNATGVDLPGERDGRVPDRAWKESVHEAYPRLYPEDLWLPGDTINMSIGQGDLLVTPLQLATGFAALANGGTLYEPQLARQVQDPEGEVLEAFEPKERGTVSVPPGAREAILQGLQGVVSAGTGTATTAFAGFPFDRIPVAGKTGTSEVIVDGKDANHSWFAAFAPADDPRYVAVALVEQGGHGSQVAAPIVRRILEGIFGLTPTEFHIGQAVD